MTDKELYQNARLYLFQIKDILKRLEDIHGYILGVRERLESPNTSLNKENRITLVNGIAQIMDLEKKAILKYDEFNQIKEEAIHKINNVISERYKEVLMSRYIELKEWKQIAEDFNYRGTKKITNLHSRALDEFAQVNKDFIILWSTTHNGGKKRDINTKGITRRG